MNHSEKSLEYCFVLIWDDAKHANKWMRAYDMLTGLRLYFAGESESVELLNNIILLSNIVLEHYLNSGVPANPAYL